MRFVVLFAVLLFTIAGCNASVGDGSHWEPSIVLLLDAKAPDIASPVLDRETGDIVYPRTPALVFIQWQNGNQLKGELYYADDLDPEAFFSHGLPEDFDLDARLLPDGVYAPSEATDLDLEAWWNWEDRADYEARYPTFQNEEEEVN